MATSEQQKHNVYRVDPQTGDVKVVVDDFCSPTVFAFRRTKRGCISSTAAYPREGVPPTFACSMSISTPARCPIARSSLTDSRPALTDGMRGDVEGNIWCSVGWGDPKEDGVRCYTPAGELLGKIHIPETVGNLSFGGVLRNRLYIGATSSVYGCYVGTQGAGLPRI